MLARVCECNQYDMKISSLVLDDVCEPTEKVPCLDVHFC
ncbi:MAG: hypothetical protein OJF50_000551 [Nitrospira sp.]|jgi:hypothetical protein|nr:hypothetical protein [Nitrospira sp.]